jgi:DNA-binding HxlR family transcriptional regulator
VLERDGMVERTAYPTVPVTVEYRLTPLGHELADTVHVVRQWAYTNIEAIQDARARYDAGTAAAPDRPGPPGGRLSA